MCCCPFPLPVSPPCFLYFSLSLSLSLLHFPPILFLSPPALCHHYFPISSPSPGLFLPLLSSYPCLSVAAYLSYSVPLHLCHSPSLPLSLSPSVPPPLRQVGSVQFWAGRSAQDILRSSAFVCWLTKTGSARSTQTKFPWHRTEVLTATFPVYSAPHAHARTQPSSPSSPSTATRAPSVTRWFHLEFQSFSHFCPFSVWNRSDC